MSYKYANERPRLFTEEGMATVLKVRDNASRLLKIAGAFRADKAWEGCSGDSWLMIAAIEYLVEQKMLLRADTGDFATQHRVYVAGGAA